MQEPSAQNFALCSTAAVPEGVVCTVQPSVTEDSSVVKNECSPSLNQHPIADVNSTGGEVSLIDGSGCKFAESTTALVPIDVTIVQSLQIIHTQAGTILTAPGTLEGLNGMAISMTQDDLAEPVPAHQIYGKVWQVIPTVSCQKDDSQAVMVAPSNDLQPVEQGETSEESQQSDNGQQAEQDTGVTQDTLVTILTQPMLKAPPPNAPSWALSLNDCELIGDSYRGWVASEVDLDLVLTHHKHQTGSCWGTRQSTGSHRNSLRLMWKSQYVPYDGIPFINAGSRAIVMECQYGPRRKGGNPWKKISQNLPEGEFKQTCPARIYIKKVRKFPKFQVDPNMDKKSLRTSMEKAFLHLKTTGFEGHGEDRWYVQLPTESAHEFHDGSPTGRWPQSKKQAKITNLEDKKGALADQQGTTAAVSSKKLSRIHPHLVEKIRDLVSHGESSVFVIRRQLRKYVEKEMFTSNGEVPERHNLCYFPTIHDIQNHVFEALKDLRTGKLPLLVPSVNIEVPNKETKDMTQLSHQNSGDSNNPHEVWDTNATAMHTTGEAGSNDMEPQIQTITVTLTRCNEPGQAPVISKIESHFTDGTTKVATTMTQETFDLLSRLHPSIFPPGSLIQINPEMQDGLIQPPLVNMDPVAEGTIIATGTLSDCENIHPSPTDSDPIQVLSAADGGLALFKDEPSC